MEKQTTFFFTVVKLHAITFRWQYICPIHLNNKNTIFKESNIDVIYKFDMKRPSYCGGGNKKNKTNKDDMYLLWTLYGLSWQWCQ